MRNDHTVNGGDFRDFLNFRDTNLNVSTQIVLHCPVSAIHLMADGNHRRCWEICFESMERLGSQLCSSFILMT